MIQPLSSRIALVALTILAAGALPGAAFAAEVAPPCTVPGELPNDLAAWAMLYTGKAATDARSLTGAGLVIGQASQITLAPTEAITYPLRPEKPGGPGTFGGLLRFVVARQGTYRVVLGTAAWIDLVAPGGTAVPSAGHSHGPACTGIRKIVEFALIPGSYTLQMSGNATRATEVLVTGG
jgi:hypothetical protein